MPTYAVYIGPFDMERHFDDDFGGSGDVAIRSESALPTYLFNRWPALTIQPSIQIRSGRDPRKFTWIFETREATKPCAAVVGLENPMEFPVWEFWRPYFDARKGD